MKKKIFVGNLSWKVTEEILKPVFEAYGEVVSVKIVVDRYTGKSKGFGFVEMGTPEAAEKAITGLNDTPLLERNLRVSLAQPRPDSPREGGGGMRSGAPRGGDREYRGGGGGDRGERGGDRGGERSFRPRGERNYNS